MRGTYVGGGTRVTEGEYGCAPGVKVSGGGSGGGFKGSVVI